MGAAVGGKEGIALISAMLGSSLIGGLTAPQGQQLQSFEGKGGNDPNQMMGETKGLMMDYLNTLIDTANSPAKINTTVNPLPSFKGGALPMAIAAPGMDANRLNPELRSKEPAAIMPKRRLSGSLDPSSGIVPTAPTPGTGGAPPPGQGQQPYVGEGPDPNDPNAADAAINLLLGSGRRTF